MPTCPACGVSVGYEELRTHVGTCRFVWSEAPRRTDRLTQHLAAKVRALEQHLPGGDATRERSDAEDDDRAREDGSDREPHRLR